MRLQSRLGSGIILSSSSLYDIQSSRASSVSSSWQIVRFVHGTTTFRIPPIQYSTVVLVLQRRMDWSTSTASKTAHGADVATPRRCHTPDTRNHGATNRTGTYISSPRNDLPTIVETTVYIIPVLVPFAAHSRSHVVTSIEVISIYMPTTGYMFHLCRRYRI
jgi:hypothetical protein